MEKKQRKNYEYIPVCLLGYSFTLPGNCIVFKRCGVVERLELFDSGWVYSAGRVREAVDMSTMDAILLGWYTQYDQAHGCVVIQLHTFRDGTWSWVQYRH